LLAPLSIIFIAPVESKQQQQAIPIKVDVFSVFFCVESAKIAIFCVCVEFLQMTNRAIAVHRKVGIF
jgi:hypothetical protein